MINFALIGVSGYGARHVLDFSRLERWGHVKVCALADISETALQQTSSLFQDVRLYTDYRQLFDLEQIDAVVIATPIPFHEEMTREAIQRGFYVLLEKPAVPTMSQLEGLIGLEGSERVGVAFQRVSAPSTRALKRVLCSGGLGQLRSLSVTAVWPRSSAYYERASWAGQLEWNGRPVLDGPATNALSHWINNMMFLAGGTMDEFDAPIEVFGEAYRIRAIRGHDTACVGGRLASGSRFYAGFSHAASVTLQARLRIEGTKGVAWMGENGDVHSEDVDIREYESADEHATMRRRFIDFATGRLDRPDVGLADVRGYTLAVNLMFQSSKGIHKLPIGRNAEGGNGRTASEVVPDIGPILQRGEASLAPLWTVGIPWAVKCEPMKAGEFIEQEMLASLGISDSRTLAHA